MKKIKEFHKFLFVLTMLGLIVACNSDDNGGGTNPPPTGEEDPFFDASVNTNSTEADESVTFADNSTGVTSRTWTFPGGTPSSSSDEEVNVSFSHEGPVTCTLEVTFNDGTSETKDFVIQVGNELYSRVIFGFEDDSKVSEAWKIWNSSGNTGDLSYEIDESQGANGSSKSLKVTFSNSGNESQIFTKENEIPFNAILESNTTYTFSFWIKGDVPSITAAQLENLWVVNGEEIQSWMGFGWISPVYITNEWVQFSQVIETGDLSENYSEGRALNAFTQFKFIPEEAGVVYIDEISIKEGDFGTNIPEPINFDATVSSTTTEVGSPIVFTDNSTSVKSRNWIFPSGTPASSTDREVSVTFDSEGTYTCTLEVTFSDDSVQNTEFEIVVGSVSTGVELYDRGVFGFEDPTEALANWTLWNSSGNDDITIEVDETQGANGTDNSLKITVNNTGNETQLLTRDNPVNAVLSEGKNYTFSFYIKGEENATLNVAEAFLGDNDPWTQYFWTNSLEITTEWQKVSFTFSSQDPFVAENADNVFTQFKFIPDTARVIYIDEVSLEEKD